MIKYHGRLEVPAETLDYADPIKFEHYKVNSPGKFKVHALSSANVLVGWLADLLDLPEWKLDFVYFSCCRGAEPHTDQLNPDKFEDTTYVIPVILPTGKSVIRAEEAEVEVHVGGVYEFDHTRVHSMELEDTESGCVVIMVGVLKDSWINR